MSTRASRNKNAHDVPLDEAYFVWLYSQIGSVEKRNLSRTYWKLLRLLYRKEFSWDDETMEKDGNRAQDGKDLRRRFLEETDVVNDESGWLEMGCSMLELLIGLALRLEFTSGSDRAVWFWEMIANLGLTECTDADPPDEHIIEHVLNKVIDRDYLPNGAGGLFPLNTDNVDQRGVELWYQANAYLLERI